MTNKELAARVEELEAELKMWTDDMPETAKLLEKIDELDAKIEELKAENKKLETALAQPEAVNIDGFLLEYDDPFAAGVLRIFLKNTEMKATQRPMLPFTLPYKDPASVIAAKNYLVRAGGSGQPELVDAIVAAFGKKGIDVRE